MTFAGEEVVKRPGAVIPYGDGRLGSGTALKLISDVNELGAGWMADRLPQHLSETGIASDLLYLRRETGHEGRALTEYCLLIRTDRFDSVPGARYVRLVKSSAPDLPVYKATADVMAGFIRAQEFSVRHRLATPSRVTTAEQRAYDLYQKALAAGATDIHIEVFNQGRYAPQYVIRGRVNGTLVPFETRNSPEEVESVEEMIRVMYQHPEYSKEAERTPGTFSPGTRCTGRLTPPVQEITLRFESDPTVSGYSVALRILDYKNSSVARTSLEGLGLSAHQSKALMRASLLGDGLILIYGETGSGKTTTLATLLELDPDKDTKKRISLEDPPELDISSVQQFRVSKQTLREVAVAVVRQDPDVIYVGEVNSRETASLAQNLALTGHTTFGTFHASNCVTALQRLTSDEIGLDLSVISMERFLRALLFQRLVPQLCPHCRRPASEVVDPDDLLVFRQKFNIHPESLFVANRAVPGEEPCPHCKGKGHVGQVLLAELVIPDRRFLELVQMRRFTDAMDHFRRQRVTGFDDLDTRGKTWQEHALARAANGQICTRLLLRLEDFENYQLVDLNERAPVGGS